MIALNIGCGLSVYPGWVNVDNSPTITLSRVPLLKRFVTPWPKEVKKIDVLRGLPFADSSVDYIYSSHAFEHFTNSKSLGLLKECHRVLRAKGVCRICVPDLGKMVNDYLSDRSPVASHAFIDRLLIKTTWRDLIHPGANHRQMFDSNSLSFALEQAGFSVRVCEYGESKIPNILDIELKVRASESLYVEGEK
jgi:predicted SAM-dependent methyltransferase